MFLGNAKTGHRFNRREHVVIGHPVALLITAALKDVRLAAGKEGAFFWSQPAAVFHAHFQQLISFFRTQHLRFHLYSLRRGGATDDFCTFGSMERVLQKGRWSTSAAANVCINEVSDKDTSCEFSWALPYGPRGVLLFVSVANSPELCHVGQGECRLTERFREIRKRDLQWMQLLKADMFQDVMQNRRITTKPQDLAAC